WEVDKLNGSKTTAAYPADDCTTHLEPHSHGQTIHPHLDRQRRCRPLRTPRRRHPTGPTSRLQPTGRLPARPPGPAGRHGAPGRRALPGGTPPRVPATPGGEPPTVGRPGDRHRLPPSQVAPVRRRRCRPRAVPATDVGPVGRRP